MASEMVERAARAIYAEWHSAKMAVDPHSLPDTTWDEGADKPLWLFIARAAIAALREPTEAMETAGRNAGSFISGFGGVETPPGAATFTVTYKNFGGPPEVWRAMVDKMLAE